MTSDGAEAGPGVLVGIWQRAVEELGSLTPPAQLRALLLTSWPRGSGDSARPRSPGRSPG